MSDRHTFNPINIEFLPNGRGGMYYNYKDINYDYRFPAAWAFSQVSRGEGPNFCETCRKNGFRNGVFICCCPNCSLIFNGGQELVATKLGHYEMTTKLPYMNGTTLEDIGLPLEEPVQHPAYGILEELKTFAQEEEEKEEEEPIWTDVVWNGLKWITKAEAESDHARMWGRYLEQQEQEQDDETASTHSSMPSLIDLEEQQAPLRWIDAREKYDDYFWENC